MRVIPFTIRPNIPEQLAPLDEIAHNLWVSWNFDAIQLFIRLDYDAWMESSQNPVKMLGLVPQEKLEEMAGDDSFLAAMNVVYQKFRRYVDGPKWYSGPEGHTIAYFSMEYGLDVNLPVYSGGLGILAGDHLKTSSDLGLPLVAVGLLYRQGYFRQYLNPDGFQQEQYPDNDWYNLPVKLYTDEVGESVSVTVPIGETQVAARVWEVNVGRMSLFLLDANIEQNDPASRAITQTLYGGDKDMRIRQEILLGVGGMRALRKMGIEPAVTHMNEGHSAFLALEKIHILMQEQHLTFEEAREATRPTNVFTTHTPVPAGNERFSPDLMKKYFSHTVSELGLNWQQFLALGREDPANKEEPFCLTVLALKLSSFANGVSRLHGEVSRRMWSSIWPGVPVDEIPIGHVTNAVHPRSWLSHDMVDLLDRYFGPRFIEEPMDLDIWENLDRVSDEELWRSHERRRERLVVLARDRLRKQYVRRGLSETDIAMATEVLSPYALTICFARRFATYKRSTLLLKDPERLMGLLSNTERPVQLIFAGKAHPHDMEGKELIKEIIHFARDPGVRSRIIFLEDYDITIARYLVSGSDVWLNTPRRPQEASGTSGMKAAMNGSLNLSILDGWWAEAYNPEVGWAIGRGEEYSDPALQDTVEGKALYDLLEDEIIPLFYTRGRDGLPREWIKRMKATMKMIGTGFSSHRMLRDYTEAYYIPALANFAGLRRDNFTGAKSLAAYLKKVGERWKDLSIDYIEVPQEHVMLAGDTLRVSVKVNLAGLDPEEVAVELCHGPLSAMNQIHGPATAAMQLAGKIDDTYHRFQAELHCEQTGRQGIAVRIMPRHPAMVGRMRSELIKWA